ncbi:uncharacterized protein F5891DRAFT_1194579 [Suillus fuscotomentosus]|uniref:Uncharacterized protein n=1 Tax=Suillus fuscotomentosus TaxID=1912939 RepID=A0AAD4DWB8_9AGAM|nr:uncharacterized protein F5891DRAFT_1194579 [Suillus fuscotomentosus]KAG1895070.1 hypothetical protein F5891DRAFT_1194579 [Suillus fuscotomentosus]
MTTSGGTVRLGSFSLGQSYAPPLLCSSVPLLLCSSAPLLLCSSAPLLLCSSAPLLLCSSAPLLLCSSAPPILHSSEVPEVPPELSCTHPEVTCTRPESPSEVFCAFGHPSDIFRLSSDTNLKLRAHTWVCFCVSVVTVPPGDWSEHATTAITLDDLCRLCRLPTSRLYLSPQLRRVASELQISPPKEDSKTNLQHVAFYRDTLALDIEPKPPHDATLNRLKTNLRFIQHRATTNFQKPFSVPTHSKLPLPIHVVTAPTPNTGTMTTIVPLPSFYSDYEKEEEPTTWFRQYQLSVTVANLSFQDKIDRFELQCAAGSMAEVWVRSLTAADKASWSTFAAAFARRWPPPTHITFTLAQQKDRIKAITLKEEDIGRMIEKERGREWGHVKWAKEIERTAQGFRDTGCLLMDVVLENTPAILRDLLTEQYTSWPDFVTDVNRISLSQLQRTKQRIEAEQKLWEDVDWLQAQAMGMKKTPAQSMQATEQPAAPAWQQYRPFPPRYAPPSVQQQQQQQQTPQFAPTAQLAPTLPPQPQTPQTQMPRNPFSTGRAAAVGEHPAVPMNDRSSVEQSTTIDSTGTDDQSSPASTEDSATDLSFSITTSSALDLMSIPTSPGTSEFENLSIPEDANEELVVPMLDILEIMSPSAASMLRSDPNMLATFEPDLLTTPSVTASSLDSMDNSTTDSDPTTESSILTSADVHTEESLSVISTSSAMQCTDLY